MKIGDRVIVRKIYSEECNDPLSYLIGGCGVIIGSDGDDFHSAVFRVRMDNNYEEEIIGEEISLHETDLEMLERKDEGLQSPQ